MRKSPGEEDRRSSSDDLLFFFFSQTDFYFRIQVCNVTISCPQPHHNLVVVMPVRNVWLSTNLTRSPKRAQSNVRFLAKELAVQLSPLPIITWTEILKHDLFQILPVFTCHFSHLVYVPIRMYL